MHRKQTSFSPSFLSGKINLEFHGSLFNFSARQEIATTFSVKPQSLAVYAMLFAFTEYIECLS